MVSVGSRRPNGSVMPATDRSPSPRIRRPSPRRISAFALSWTFAAAVYLLLIDTTDVPELIVGAVAALLGAIATELSRDPRVAVERAPLIAFARLHRPLLRVPSDTVLLSRAVVARVRGRRVSVGAFRSAPFRCSPAHERSDRRALAEIAGSLAPNTVVVGIDTEAQRLIVHQLVVTSGRGGLDPLELG